MQAAEAERKDEERVVVVCRPQSSGFVAGWMQWNREHVRVSINGKGCK